tara:strand:- start:477 stop:875 length:399 start_codon:yes stop_codon:yes gene_type:complete
MKRRTFRAGGKNYKKKKAKYKKKRGKHLKPFMSKPRKGKPIKKKFGITIRRRKRPSVIISQPRKRRYTINVGRRRPHVQSISYSDRSVFSSGTGMKPKYMRKAMVKEQVDDRYKGAFMLQDNDRVMLGRYPN